MAGSVNKVILVGNLGRDPEVRSFPNGGKVVNLRVATSERWRDKKTGENKERTEWHSVAIFNENLGADRRAVPAQGLEGLPRGPARDPQVAGRVRPGPLHHRGGAAPVPRRDDPARRPRRGRGRLRPGPRRLRRREPQPGRRRSSTTRSRSDRRRYPRISARARACERRAGGGDHRAAGERAARRRGR